MSTNLFALLKAAGAEASLDPRLGKWRQAISKLVAVLSSTSGSVIFLWNGESYPAAAGTYYMMSGGTTGLPGVAGTQLATTVDWSRTRLPFPVQLEGMSLFNRLQNATATVTYDLRHNNDATSINVLTKPTNGFSAIAPLDIRLPENDILTVQVTVPNFGVVTDVQGILTVWGRRVS